MKGLHNIRIPPPTMTWRWYSSYVSRRGRRHLLHVPLEDVDVVEYIRNIRQLSYRYRYLSTRERTVQAARDQEDGWGMLVPGRVYPASPAYERYCAMEQAANSYGYEHVQITGRGDVRPRGFCDTCWNAWLNMRADMHATRNARSSGVLRTNGPTTAYSPEDIIELWRIDATNAYRLR